MGSFCRYQNPEGVGGGEDVYFGVKTLGMNIFVSKNVPINTTFPKFSKISSNSPKS